MSPVTPQIGFDRFIPLELAEAALRTRAGIVDASEVERLLDFQHVGPSARKKTKTVLNRLWLNPRAELDGLCLRGVHAYLSQPDVPVAALTWGMAIASYPFFAKVAEISGRLLAIQGFCTSAEVHRRMAEFYGEREGTRRMTNMVLQSQEAWGCVSRSEGGRLIERQAKISVPSDSIGAWLVEACLICAGRDLPVAALDGHPIIYPFSVGDRIGFAISQSNRLEMRMDSSGNQYVGLAAH